MWWVNKSYCGDGHYLDNDLETDDYIIALHGYDSRNKNKDYPAYSLQDILNPDNLKRAFGEVNIEIEAIDFLVPMGLLTPPGEKIKCNGWVMKSWKYHGQKLLEAYWDDGIGGVEKYLENNL